MRCKFTHKSMMILSVFFASLSARAQSLSEINNTNDFATLCSIGIEGTFQGFIAKTPALFNVICLDRNRMAMGINYGTSETAMQLTLINSLIDDDGTLVFSISPLDQADRKSATSGSPAIYVRLDTNALKKGMLSGVFLGGNSVKPQVLGARKKIGIPPIPSLKSITVNPKNICGTYQFKLPGLSSFLFWFDMVKGVPIVTIYDGDKGLHLIDGPSWDGTGGFAVTNVFGDFMPVSSANLIQMRGYVTKVGEIEMYYVDPIHGVQGPIAAIRQ